MLWFGSLKFNWGAGIQFCIAMSESDVPKFNNIIRQIIEKSLFTERQIEIILNQWGLKESKISITRGAYYRQVGQTRDKLAGLYYAVVLLRGLGVLLPDDVDVMLKLSEQISVIKDGDIPPEAEEKIIPVVDQVIRKMCSV